MIEPDFNFMLDSKPSNQSGVYMLWLAVTIDAFFTLRDGLGNEGMARGWIEDPDNIFFDAVCEQMEFSPDALRERIREALARHNQDVDGIADKIHLQ
ncbi:MAG: hypothetical protein ABSB79_12335 [Syntrophales bacterium]|jgi:hypothetical protein